MSINLHLPNFLTRLVKLNSIANKHKSAASSYIILSPGMWLVRFSTGPSAGLRSCVNTSSFPAHPLSQMHNPLTQRPWTQLPAAHASMISAPVMPLTLLAPAGREMSLSSCAACTEAQRSAAVQLGARDERSVHFAHHVGAVVDVSFVSHSNETEDGPTRYGPHKSGAAVCRNPHC
eukprot:3374671-Pleurochrysis_carterae.AAC.1